MGVREGDWHGDENEAGDSENTAMSTANRVRPAPASGFEVACETLIIGAGAAGLVAALSAHEAGQELLD